MYPRSDTPPPESHLLKKPSTATPIPSPAHAGKSTAFQTLLLSAPRRALLIFIVLSLQLILLLSARSIPAQHFRFLRPAVSSSADAIAVAPAPAEARGGSSSCDSGMVYVYDLPPLFNRDLIDDCTGLNPWRTRCTALSNGGFGPLATDLVGIVPDSLLPSWFSTNQFAAELIYHRRMMAQPCLTTDPSAASAFYIPFYAGLSVGKHLWSANSSSDERDRACADLLRWLETQPPWRKSGGSDHFIVLGRITWDFRRSHDRDWGGSFLYMPGMENVTRLLIERNPWDERDVGIPYPTGFHPQSTREVREWQAFVLNRPRSTLFSFAGAARSTIKNDFRGVLLSECARAGDGCRAVDCSGGRCGNRTAETLSLFLESSFCLQPRGDSFTRRSMFDCMVAGAIPVIFWRRSAYAQYAWYLPTGDGDVGDPWSVFIDRQEVRSGAVSLREVLGGMGEERIRKMRERVVGLIPRLVYAAVEKGLGEGMEDAFDVAVRGVLRRFRDRRRREGRNRR
ncbi:Xyloglucan galactosyltransferase KATAMARI1 [Apostasia shenzhenica]|uniref:Xyloglucan galactosyltransferase KATAMARI1 n=1 Tax=Apostasia shenzhenica TaxID=1088818 RepID=A0A2I0AY41_9ASPA|nr:Xyloglucan galactosyltransferase KATAMARI1 [Apostasia shenzhenica]